MTEKRIKAKFDLVSKTHNNNRGQEYNVAEHHFTGETRKMMRSQDWAFLKMPSLLLLALLFSACATVVIPDGGPKDTTPPKPLKFEPSNSSVNFTSKKIIITFDEIIQLKDLNANLVVSPQMKKAPEIIAQGKKLIIKLPDSLEANTTYNIFLGSSIINYTENIPLPKLQYVFSTGTTLDSLMFKGKIVNAFDLKGVDGAVVMLYTSDDDSLPLKSKPFYLTKTFANGEFELTNLSGGKYKIFALKDLNSNYIYDQSSEEIAFLDSLIAPEPNPDSLKLDSLTPRPVLPEIKLRMFKENEKKQTLLSNKVINQNLVTLVFRLPADSFGFDVVKGKISKHDIYKVVSRNLDSVNLWVPFSAGDSLKLNIFSSGNFRDTLDLVLKKKSRKPAQDSLASKPQKFRFKNYATAMIPYFSDLIIDFEKPIKRLDASMIKVVDITDSIPDTLKTSVFLADSVAADRVVIKVNLNEESKYSLIIPDSCVFNIFEETHDSIVSTFVTTKSRNYGNLKLNINHNFDHNLIINLIDSKGVLIAEKNLKDSLVEFKHLTPGEYKVKLIFDENSNGKWDTGNYMDGIFPERVIFLEKPLNIRANWDVEEKWVI